MPDVEIELPEVYLQPGEVHLARSPAILKTILGSCVGVTFSVTRLGLGALCHGVLPTCPPGTSGAEGYRYVDFAICDLLERFERLGSRRAEIEVKVFGGADVLVGHTPASGRFTVGRQNCDCALAVLREQGMKIAASDLGGAVGRAIQFHTGTGEVLLRRLAQMNADD
ncbi:MAG: chemotaxis protein CheD [Terriglobales bacterium]